MQSLTYTDMIAVRRHVASDLDWQDLNVSPLVRELLANASGKAGIKALETLIGADSWRQMLSISPDEQPEPVADQDAVFMPSLPAAAQLTHKALKEAESCGLYVDKFMEWATRRSPMTPASFLEAGVVWLIALAIARRIHINLYKPVHPNLYVLWIAETSIFKKSTGMAAIADVIRHAAPHLLLPQEMTPEAFILTLAGRKPARYDDLPTRQKNHIDMGRKFAAQRGILIDEASSLLGATRKDYMQGQQEMLLRAFDSGDQEYRRLTASEGFVEISDLSLSILGATTPAALVRNVGNDTWETGEMARYALLYPDRRPAYQLSTLSPDEYRPPNELIWRLKTLHDDLPFPPDLDNVLSGQDAPKRESLQATITKEAFAAQAAYTEAVQHTLLVDSLDNRLWPNYTRLSELCLKTALAIAAIDWADSNSPRKPPCITLGVWARAQQIAESWRLSLHRLIKAVDTGEDARTESRVLNHLTRYPQGETLRDLTRRTGLKRQAITDALQSLSMAGLARESVEKKRGQEVHVFYAI
jgi:hypothetical protein